ncbi:glutathione-regulated potassium-efflux system oxidoreductase KefF [Algoriphagus aquimarinus]|uniref:Kef-type potassium/proton antiporter accessory protein, CPA2 family n=1 Tax=Algoriphagus aquimarinus TaxID=237018 RepID=A0A1I1CHW7_9BACT|nr:NAD(P)H-dependent oxidoreductase [Algoriphagus aquimarinus]SFB60498.1 Kef-type potassium/proton antiporter accessory protein, CPA2 family [Algoriphagus aquimarinus]|tara:strand:+ start:91426 stop:91986 length:561 start_codon:yes stop_codon:yes gene_type:complete
MRKVLVLFAHPKFEHSEVNQALIKAITGLENIEIRDLYELYPDFNISIQKEQEALFEAEVVIWHHPIYWYSCPPLMKQWIDLVLEFAWAYGPGGIYLKGKYILNAITTGGSQEAYQHQGRNNYEIGDFLRPFEQTARLCHMHYLAPFHVAGTHKITDQQLLQKAHSYKEFLLNLRDGADISQFNNR